MNDDNGMRNEEEENKESLKKQDDLTNDYENNTNKRKRKGNKKVIILTVVLLIITNTITAVISPRIYSNLVTKIPFEDIKKFKSLFAVKGNIDKYYVDKYKEEELIDGAIKGMVSSVGDPYTTYMDVKDYEKWNSETGGKYVGIGIQIGVTKDNQVVVVAPFKGSPADRAGIMPNDSIVKVNDLSVTPDNLDQAIAKMKGKKDTKIHLTLWRKDKGQFAVDLVTEEITMHTVTSKMLEGNIGYISMAMFDENSGDAFIEELKNVRNKNASGVIVDLRGNPGGLVSQCIKITSQFVPEGNTIVYTKDKEGNKDEYKSVGGIGQNLPLVILVDKGSASASEIFSAAIRDYKLGTLVGTNTFGKGKVQSVLDRSIFGLKEGTALKVTTSYYYTPNGENIDKKGIEPNVIVEYPVELMQKAYEESKDPQLQKAIEVMKEKINKK